ncbi:DUF5945 family protein [Streptococcus suis]
MQNKKLQAISVAIDDL